MINFQFKLQFYFHLEHFSGHENEVNQLYWANEQRCRFITKNMLKFYLIFNESSIIAPLIISIFMILFGKFDSSKLILPFTLAVPFKTDNIWGWYMLLFIQLSISITYSSVMIGIASYFICCCLYVGSVCDHLELTIQSTTQANTSSFDEHSDKIVQRMLKKSIEVHLDVIEYVIT